jgi:hypothetical protein
MTYNKGPQIRRTNPCAAMVWLADMLHGWSSSREVQSHDVTRTFKAACAHTSSSCHGSVPLTINDQHDHVTHIKTSARVSIQFLDMLGRHQR